jgi:hypothetical protein
MVRINSLTNHFVPATIIRSHRVGDSPQWLITILSLPVLFRGWQSTTLRLAKNCTSMREQFSLQNWNETTQKDQLKRLYVSGSNLKRPFSEWRQHRNLDTRKAPRHYYVAFMPFVSNTEAKSLLLRQCRILPPCCVNLRTSLGSLASAGSPAMRHHFRTRPRDSVIAFGKPHDPFAGKREAYRAAIRLYGAEFWKQFLGGSCVVRVVRVHPQNAPDRAIS